MGRAARGARRRLVARGVFCTLGTVTALGACEAVPNLTFVQAEASVDASVDATPDASLDAVATDAPVESTFPADAGCPTAPPPGATCCGASPCTGDCDGRCPDCEGQCMGGTPMCCIKNMNVVCRAIGARCP